MYREYALGSLRTDLYIEWPLDSEQGFWGPVQRVVLELKILYGDREKLIATGLVQTTIYADKCSADEAHLIIFNRNPKISWEEKISLSWIEHGGRQVGVWGI